MKRIICTVITAIVAMTAVLLSGCGAVKYSLTDLSQYKNLDFDSVTKIHVNYDMGGYYTEYDITDKDDIDSLKRHYLSNDAFYMMANIPHAGCGDGYITLYNEETEITKISLGHISDGIGHYCYNGSVILNSIRICGERQDYFRGFEGLKSLIGGKVDVENIVKIKAFIQQGDNWLAPNYATYEITEAESVDYLAEKLRYRKAFIKLNELWDSDDLSYIEVYDGLGGHGAVMLNYGSYKLVDGDVYEFILDYGRTNGYLTD